MKILLTVITTLLILIILLIVYKIYVDRIVSIPEKSKISVLLRQTARYSHASRQDEDPLIALLHANYGAGYLFALKDSFTEKQITSQFSSQQKYLQFQKLVIDAQDKATKKAVNKCPSIINKKDMLTKIGGEGSIP